jgi:hypothetical protein
LIEKEAFQNFFYNQGSRKLSKSSPEKDFPNSGIKPASFQKKPLKNPNKSTKRNARLNLNKGRLSKQA